MSTTSDVELRAIVKEVRRHLHDSGVIDPGLTVGQDAATGHLVLSFRDLTLACLELDPEERDEDRPPWDLAQALLDAAGDVTATVFRVLLDDFEREELPAIRARVLADLAAEGVDEGGCESLRFLVDDAGYTASISGRSTDREAEQGYPGAALRVTDGELIDCAAELDLETPGAPLRDHDGLVEALLAAIRTG